MIWLDHCHCLFTSCTLWWKTLLWCLLTCSLQSLKLWNVRVYCDKEPMRQDNNLLWLENPLIPIEKLAHLILHRHDKWQLWKVPRSHVCNKSFYMDKQTQLQIEMMVRSEKDWLNCLVDLNELVPCLQPIGPSQVWWLLLSLNVVPLLSVG